MSDRELVLDVVRDMPEDLSLREILEELQLMETLRERLAVNAQGNGVPASELLGQVSAWATR